MDEYSSFGSEYFATQNTPSHLPETHEPPTNPVYDYTGSSPCHDNSSLFADRMNEQSPDLVWDHSQIASERPLHFNTPTSINAGTTPQPPDFVSLSDPPRGGAVYLETVELDLPMTTPTPLGPATTPQPASSVQSQSSRQQHQQQQQQSKSSSVSNQRVQDDTVHYTTENETQQNQYLPEEFTSHLILDDLQGPSSVTSSLRDGVHIPCAPHTSPAALTPRYDASGGLEDTLWGLPDPPTRTIAAFPPNVCAALELAYQRGENEHTAGSYHVNISKMVRINNMDPTLHEPVARIPRQSASMLRKKSKKEVFVDILSKCCCCCMSSRDRPDYTQGPATEQIGQRMETPGASSSSS